MSLTASAFLLPDAEPSWRFWKSLSAAKSETLETPSECRESGRPVVVGLPATAGRTVGLMLPTADAKLLPTMVEAQLERRGIVVEKLPAPNFAWHLLGTSGGQTFVSVDVLANPFPDDLAVPTAANYTAALRMRQLPQNDLVVVEEQGQLVLGAGLQGRLWHSHIIGNAETGAADLAREMEIAKMTLETQEGFSAVRGVSLVGERLALLANELKKHTAIPISTITALHPNRTLNVDSFQRMLPRSVYQAQASRARRRQLASVGVLTSIIYVLLFVIGWWYLQGLQAKVSTLQAEIDKTNAPASEIRKTHDWWVALEPAIEPQRYPMTILSQVTSIMPPSGVVLKRYEAKPAEIELNGDARDAQTASQFVEDLKKHPKLSRYNWNMPVPTVKDKAASFKIQGKLDK